MFSQTGMETVSSADEIAYTFIHLILTVPEVKTGQTVKRQFPTITAHKGNGIKLIQRRTVPESGYRNFEDHRLFIPGLQPVFQGVVGNTFLKKRCDYLIFLDTIRSRITGASVTASAEETPPKKKRQAHSSLPPFSSYNSFCRTEKPVSSTSFILHLYFRFHLPTVENIPLVR